MSRKAAYLEPRLLSREAAAGYCGLSVPTFERECPVKPFRFRKRVVYDKARIDHWIDSLSVENGSGTVAHAGFGGETNPWDNS